MDIYTTGEVDAFDHYLETNTEPLGDSEESFDALSYWFERRDRQPALARMAFDILAIPVMSDDYERSFSSAGILLNKRRARLQMDIIEANEFLRDAYSTPAAAAFDDNEVNTIAQLSEGYRQPRYKRSSSISEDSGESDNSELSSAEEEGD